MGSPRIGNQILAQPNLRRNSSTLVCTITGRIYDAGRSDRRSKRKVREFAYFSLMFMPLWTTCISPRLECDNSTEYTGNRYKLFRNVTINVRFTTVWGIGQFKEYLYDTSVTTCITSQATLSNMKPKTLNTFYVPKSAKINLFVHKTLFVIYDTGNDLNVPHIYFNGP